MNAADLDTRISDALHAQAELVTEAQLRPARAPRGAPGRRPRRAWITRPRQAWITRPHRAWSTPLLAAAVVAAVAVGTTIAVRAATTGSSAPPRPIGVLSGGPFSVPPSQSPPVTTSPTGAPVTVPAPPVSGQPGSPTASTSVSKAPAGFVLGEQPLWPFGSYQQAVAWSDSYAKQGSQPWHLDAGQTALSFTRGYLGFSDITIVTSSRMDSQGAHVGVGYRNPAGKVATAAVLHLLRYGNSPRSPWEVVGSEDTTFSLELPAYGSTVSSPVPVGGHLTGVDEAIRLAVRSLDGGLVSPSMPSIAAGGADQPWHGTVAFSGHGVLTIVASTGGHLQAVERFAIQGVHT